jgi:prolyl oligopeptidase
MNRGELLVLTLCLAGVLTLLVACSMLPAQRRLHYPQPPRAAVTEDYHGIAVADPYRPLEDLDAPATRAWVSAEGQLTRSYFAAIPERARIAARLAELYRFERIGLPFKSRDHYFYVSSSALQEQGALMGSATLGEPPQVVLDPNTLPGADHPVVTGYVVSRDGRLLAYAVSAAGSDWTEWHIRNLVTGADLPDVLRFTKYYRPSFTPDGAGLYYSAFPAPQPGSELSSQDLGNALYYHRLGTATASDRRILGEPSQPGWQYEPHLTPDGRWLVVLAGEGQVGDQGREDVYLLDLAAATPQVHSLLRGFTAACVYIGAAGGELYFLTSRDAPNGRVLALDPQRPQAANWREVIPESGDAIDLGPDAGSVTLVGGRLIVRRLHDAHHRVTIYGLDGVLQREVTLPGAGSVAGFAGETEDTETFYSFSDLITPPTIYRYDMGSGSSSVFYAPRVAFDPGAFEQRQVFYRGQDGTRIPMWLAWRRDASSRGRRPVLLSGYGGFGIPMLPSFQIARIAWLEMGGVIAIANIRGGGEYGEAWHQAGMLRHKQVVFDDFIAAARWLISQRYTTRAQLAIYGRSNGGLLVGACLTQHPELFGAAVSAVGVLDMLRFNRFGQGAGWEGDYGSPQDPAQFQALYAYSPLHNVRSGTRYPATLVITGDHDTRVMPMHSYKFAAALQAAQSASAPVLLAVDEASGHGGGETVSQAVEQNADIYAFLLSNLRPSRP